ncbi:hypothetical protein D320_07449 [Haloferax sp. BAB-2207]|nr:hypothetical protein [Haloferax sp. BAB-2207]ELK54923.1 hypothetical protein D320_07449 [Haloferax sp. BAB-2207]
MPLTETTRGLVDERTFNALPTVRIAPAVGGDAAGGRTGSANPR